MAKRLAITTEQIIESLLDYYNSNAVTVTTAGVKQWAEEQGYTPTTILARLTPYKSDGKYALEVCSSLSNHMMLLQ